MSTRKEPWPSDPGETRRQPVHPNEGQVNPQEDHATNTELAQAFNRLVHSLARCSKEEQRQFLAWAITRAEELAAVWNLCQHEPSTVLDILRNHPAAFLEAVEYAVDLTREQDVEARALLTEALTADCE